MEQKTGFEPATPTLARLYSTAELLLHMRVKGVEPPRRKALDPKSSASANSATPAYTYEPYWARTSDPLIKSQMLYQLS